MTIFIAAALTIRKRMVGDALKGAGAFDFSKNGQMTDMDLPELEASPGPVEQSVTMEIIHRTSDKCVRSGDLYDFVKYGNAEFW